ncbi:MAG: hypothetical protein K940chlam3_00601 [Chlamydiae bacterium]|nr:hypothetical protein [Chlamydiota bacterium]
MKVTRSDVSRQFNMPKNVQINFKILALAVVVSNLASAILANIIFEEPLDLSLKCFSLTATMGVTLCFFYSFIIRDLDKMDSKD